MRKLEGKIARITGGNSGIGLATAKQFVNEDAYVFITGRHAPELANSVKQIGQNVTGVPGDVAKPDDFDHLFAQIKREKGKLDIVFASAGITTMTPLGKITEEDYDSISNANVKGLLFTVQKALPVMADGASIILNASIVASKGLPNWSVYSATKAAVRRPSGRELGRNATWQGPSTSFAKATLIAGLELPFWLFIVSTIGVPLLVERTPQVDVASRRHQEIK
jgi:NAD(P)-dependent dehydrogenase (short-subunit alcohol dehydrogenase family)